MVGEMSTEITEESFTQEVINSEIPVFTCFTTTWCQSCFPTCFIADHLAGYYQGRIKFIKVDKEKAPRLSTEYNITVVPTIVIFQGSKVVKKMLGFQSEDLLRGALDVLLT